MGDVDQHLGAFPGGLAFEVGRAVFRDDEAGAGTWGSHHGARRQDRRDQGYSAAILERSGGRQAQEALAAVGTVGADYEVELTAGTADLFIAGGLRADLPININRDTAVDGNELVDLRDVRTVVDPLDRRAAAGRIVVDKIIEPLAAGREGINRSAMVHRQIDLIDDLARRVKIQVRVHEHFCMNVQFIDIGIRQ